MFKNARFLRFTGAWPASEEALGDALSRAGFTPCGPLSEISSGFEPPVDGGPERLCRSVAGADLMQLRTQSRLLPAAAVNEALELRIAEYEERVGQRPGRREKRRLKAETRDKLLPQALLRSERTQACFLQSESILAIDVASPPRLERFLEMLRIALGRLETDDLSYRRPVGELLRQIFLGDAPPGIRLGRECRMQDPADSRASVRWADMDLTDTSIRRHVRDGMKLTHLGIEFDGVMSAVLDERGSLSKLKLLGTDAKDATDEEDPLTRADAELVLLTGTLGRFLGVLSRSLGGADDQAA